MKPEEREDLLLAVNRVKARTGHQPLAPDLADVVGLTLPEVSETLLALQDAGEIVIADDGTIGLTSAGDAAASVVMKKHKVLETFFEEMLGMDRADAHQEACTLEHHASEETISRLGEYIGSIPSACRPGGFIQEIRSKRPCGCQILSECREGETVCITAVKGCGRAERLADLGLIPGEEILVHRRLAKTFLVQVKGCDIAISAEIASSVLVEKC